MYTLAAHSTASGKATARRHAYAPSRPSPLAAAPLSAANTNTDAPSDSDSDYSDSEPSPDASPPPVPGPSPPRRTYTTATDCPSPAKTRPARRRASALRSSSALLAQEISEEDEHAGPANTADSVRLPHPPAETQTTPGLPCKSAHPPASRLAVATVSASRGAAARLPSALQLSGDEGQRGRRRIAATYRPVDATAATRDSCE